MPPTIVLGLKPIPLPGGARPDEEEEDSFKPLWLWTEESGVQGDAGMLRCRRAPLDTQPVLSFLVDRSAANTVAQSKMHDVGPSPEMQALVAVQKKVTRTSNLL